MASRLQLHEIFKKIPGVKRVYFSPPDELRMEYPCIRYKPTAPDVKYADNRKYLGTNCYVVTVIDEDPDSEIPNEVSELPLCKYDTFYVADNLNHTVFTIYH